jgi:hypothetical protein
VRIDIESRIERRSWFKPGFDGVFRGYGKIIPLHCAMVRALKRLF